MNTEFVKDLIDALRADPEHFKDLLLSNALADIMESLVARVVQVEEQLLHYQQAVTQRDMANGYQNALQQGSLMQQLGQMERLQLIQKQAQMLGIAVENDTLVGAGRFVELLPPPPEASQGYAAALKRVLGMKVP